MKLVALLGCCLMLGFAQAVPGPVILTRDQISENYYDEPPADVAAATGWLGLYVQDSGARLQAAAVTFDPERERDHTVHRLWADPPGPVLLFSGIEALSAGPAMSVSEWSEALSPGGPGMDIVLGSRTCRVTLGAGDPCEASVVLSDGEQRQALHEPGQSTFACGEPRFEVHWAGDLDGDQALDLVVAFKPKYSVHPRRLLLSSLAGSDELVGDAGTYEREAQ